jgi:hypothetical protein
MENSANFENNYKKYTGIDLNHFICEIEKILQKEYENYQEEFGMSEADFRKYEINLQKFKMKVESTKIDKKIIKKLYYSCFLACTIHNYKKNNLLEKLSYTLGYYVFYKYYKAVRPFYYRCLVILLKRIDQPW